MSIIYCLSNMLTIDDGLRMQVKIAPNQKIFVFIFQANFLNLCLFLISGQALITRKTNDSVVIMSLEDYNALQETAYLLRSPKNTRRLIESIAQLENGKGTERELAE